MRRESEWKIVGRIIFFWRGWNVVQNKKCRRQFIDDVVWESRRAKNKSVRFKMFKVETFEQNSRCDNENSIFVEDLAVEKKMFRVILGDTWHELFEAEVNAISSTWRVWWI